MKITIRFVPKFNSTPSSVPPTKLSAWLTQEIEKAKRIREDIKDEVSTRFAEGVFKELLKSDMIAGEYAEHILTDAQADKLARMACDTANDFNSLGVWAPDATPDPFHDIQPKAAAMDTDAFYPCGCPKTARGEAIEAIDTIDEAQHLLALNEAIQNAIRDLSTPAAQPSPYSHRDVKDKEAFRSAREMFAKDMPYMSVPPSERTKAQQAEAEGFVNDALAEFGLKYDPKTRLSKPMTKGEFRARQTKQYIP